MQLESINNKPNPSREKGYKPYKAVTIKCAYSGKTLKPQKDRGHEP